MDLNPCKVEADERIKHWKKLGKPSLPLAAVVFCMKPNPIGTL